MPIAEQKLRDILAEQEANIKRHVGVLVDETDRKFDIVSEGYQGMVDNMGELRQEIAAIRKEIEEVRMHLFRKADLDRLEAVEKRLDAVEKRVLGR
ncbi:MAG: hypothetical protein L0212_01105 [Acidobacteria bacterium]|nr:hypothetical protein [Acidobacteriota bacterium]